MDHITFAAVGFCLIGVVATFVLYTITVKRIAEPAHRTVALRWIWAFGTFLCTFMSITPFLAKDQTWVLALPLLGIFLCLDSLHRIIEAQSSASDS